MPGIYGSKKIEFEAIARERGLFTTAINLRPPRIYAITIIYPTFIVTTVNTFVHVQVFTVTSIFTHNCVSKVTYSIYNNVNFCLYVGKI